MKIEKKYITYTILVIIFGCLTYILIALLMDFDKIKQAFMDYRYEYFFLAVVLIAATWVLEGCMLKTTVAGIKKIRFRSAFKIAITTQFFNLITPFYTGGQPFTIYYFSKEGIDYEQSFAAILYKSFTFQIAISLLGSTCLMLNWNKLSSVTSGIALTSVIINLGIAFLMLFLGKHRKTVNFLVNIILNLLKKIRLLKNYEKIKININNRAMEFINMFEQFGKKKDLFFKLTLLNLINYSLYIISAIIILKGTGININPEIFSRTLLLNISSSVIPTPGTAGGVEGFYFLFLKSLVNLNILTLTVFLWRLASYYLNIFFSGLFVFFGIIRKEDKEG
ncbi:MAG TPA: lysylphosphatidylglycerol synthase transmembrane domain-containing protein [Thermotogota bacterium]|nr:lysylphosphatidylglycerol synthase transmembrane domain-containing protein [Thermotogota bacterium]HPJ87723.1 lysylphosphatidylglycerol synthase transmembrane domain-containing protein [Thermotogota bacterium]HPR94837.1 lysylphosphatidylglycerol synthase transmembrane domain-containing protein [Thermotogota bacterium]